MIGKGVKLLFALALIALIFYFVDAPALFASLALVRIESIAALFLIALVMIWVSSIKWQLFVRASGHDASILKLMHYYTIAYFFNVFTPSNLGGDIARSYHLGRLMENQGQALIATFLERFTGLVAMCFLGMLFASIGSPVTQGLEWAIFLAGIPTVLASLPCFSKRAAEIFFPFGLWLGKLVIPTRLQPKFEALVRKLDKGMSMARSNHSLLWSALAWSLVFHSLTVVNTYIAADAIGWSDPDFVGLFVAVPLVLLVSMAPLTPNGIGLQEGAFLFLLQRVGATAAEGLAVGVLLRAKVFVLALIGGILFLFERARKH